MEDNNSNKKDECSPKRYFSSCRAIGTWISLSSLYLIITPTDPLSKEILPASTTAVERIVVPIVGNSISKSEGFACPDLILFTASTKDSIDRYP